MLVLRTIFDLEPGKVELSGLAAWWPTYRFQILLPLVLSIEGNETRVGPARKTKKRFTRPPHRSGNQPRLEAGDGVKRVLEIWLRIDNNNIQR